MTDKRKDGTDSPFGRALDELADLLIKAQAPTEVRACALDLVNGGTKMFRIVAKPDPALRAGYSRLVPEASDLLMELLAAARASDWQRFMVLGHAGVPLPVDA